MPTDTLWGLEPGAVKLILVSLCVVAAFAGLLASAYRQYALSWRMRAMIAEGRVNELFMEHQEDATKRRELSWAMISERARLIDEAKAKCGEDFPHIVGTAQDPVFLSRPDADLDDIAFVATIDELVGATVEEGDQ